MQHRPAHRGRQVGPAGKAGVDQGRRLGIAERLAEGATGKGAQEGLHLGLAIRVLRLDLGVAVEPGQQEVGRLDGGLRHRLVPTFRDRHPALVTGAGIVGREGRGADKELARALRRQIATGDDLARPVRRFPFEGDAGALVLVLEEGHPQRVVASAQQEQAAAVLGHRTAADPAVDQLDVEFLVQPDADAVLGLDEELINPRLFGEDRAVPFDAELVGVQFLAHRTGGTKLEGDVGILALDLFRRRPLQVALVVLFTGCLGVGRFVARAQAAGLVDDRASAEAGKQVGNALLMLAHRQARKGDGRGANLLAGRRRVEGIIDVVRHLFGVLTAHQVRVLLRHAAVDVTRQPVDIAVTVQRLVVLLRHPLAGRAMTVGAMLVIDRLARRIRGGQGEGRKKEAGRNSEQHGGLRQIFTPCTAGLLQGLGCLRGRGTRVSRQGAKPRRRPTAPQNS